MGVYVWSAVRVPREGPRALPPLRHLPHALRHEPGRQVAPLQVTHSHSDDILISYFKASLPLDIKPELLTIMIATRFLDSIVGNNRFQSIFGSIDHNSVIVT